MLRQDSALFSRVARSLIEGAILSNRAYLRRRAEMGRPVPLLYAAGVWYEDEPHDRPDELLDIPAILDHKQRGVGADCMHLSAWRVAELRELADPSYRKLLSKAGWTNIPKGNKDARIRLTWKKNPNPKAQPKRIFHVQVRRGGVVEDPSKRLGM